VSARTERVARLAAQATDAARVRELTTHPDVIALRVERVRAQVDALLWAGIVLGLAFTMVNVQSFAAAGAQVWSPAWLVAWLLDPMVSLVLLAVLRAEQVTARYQVALPAWARRTKWLTFAATYVMNTWTSWGLDSGAGAGAVSWSGVVLHSVPPLVVFATAETGPGLRDRLTEAVHRALIEHRTAQQADTAPSPGTPADVVAPEVVAPAAVDVAGDVVDDGPDRLDIESVTARPDEVDPVAAGVVDEHGLSRLWATAPPALPVPVVQVTAEQRAAALIAEGAGRRRLASELEISEYRARRLLDHARTNPDHNGAEQDDARQDGAEVEDLGDEVAEHEQQDGRPERVPAGHSAGTNGTHYEIGGRLS
jgi:hypothetical protein